ncbi:MAG: hypothetical protein IT236_19015, partial [Bacteroidia bacterium]|nr:hypothetical protein [Bacteroidia bacterium]
MIKPGLLKKISSLFMCFTTYVLGEPDIPKKDNYKVISLGLGQQSTALYLMSSTGFIERADFAV